MALRRRCITIHVDRLWHKIQEKFEKVLAHPNIGASMMNEPTKKTTGDPALCGPFLWIGTLCHSQS